MEGIVDCDEGLVARSRRALSEAGRLSQGITDFVARPQQIEMADAVSTAIEHQSTLIVEAGTGTGKTYAYLIPALLSGKKALISTATKTLQDQLFQKDLPRLIHALGLSARIQNLKGRANYICRYRTELYADEGQFINPNCAEHVLYVRENLPRLIQGERSELPEIPEDSSAWPYVTSTSDNCLGNDCPLYENCFLVKARRRAMKAEVVVINHHLFFADSKLKDGGFGELLPGVDVVVFDEAHQLPGVATHFYGDRVSTRQLKEWLDDTIREWPVLDLANQPLKQYHFELEQLIERLLTLFSQHEERLSWENLNRSFLAEWQKLQDFLENCSLCFSDSSFEIQPGLQRCKERLEALIGLFKLFDSGNAEARIRWVERFKQSLVFHATPFEVASAFTALRERQLSTYVFTSATLTLANSFESFSRALGLGDAKTLLLSSPFDFKQQALLYLPRGMPDPNQSDYNTALLANALPLIQACGGRCFFLFTSHRSLRQVAALMKDSQDYPILVQGDEAKPILLERFREYGNAVLLGTSTFWEGVDVKGEALSCVIIDKIPFMSPSDPVTQGKAAYLKSKGLSPFAELSLPHAVLALKQGVGRLIRDSQDCGILMLADPRITGRDYGKRIFESLPPMPRTRDTATVLSFIKKLALLDESSSN